MCAIIAWAGPITNSVLRCLFDEAKTFGPHSVGLVYFDTELGKFKTFKKAIHPTQFLRNCNHRVERAARNRLGYGHVRYATHGGISDATAHPFVYPKSVDSDIIYAHNGVIQNYRGIAEEYEMPPIAVDSQCFGPLIKHHTINKAHGSTGLVWMETGTQAGLFVYRHHQNLEAAHFKIWTCHGEQSLTIVASRSIILNNLHRRCSSNGLRLVQSMPLKEYTAYQVVDSGIVEVWNCKPTYAVTYAPSSLPSSFRHLVEAPAEEEEEPVRSTRPTMSKEEVEALAREVANAFNVLIVTEPFNDNLRIYEATTDQVLEVISDLIVGDDEFVLHGATHEEDGSWTNRVLATRGTNGDVECKNESIRRLIDHVTL